MPDARCTRGLMRGLPEKGAHEHTGQRRQSDIPCAMALRLITRSPRRAGLVVTVAGEIASTGLAPAWGVRTTRLYRTLQPRFVLAASTSIATRPSS